MTQFKPNPETRLSSGATGAELTVIELLLIVIIAGLLGLMILPNWLGRASRAQTAEALTVLDRLRQGQDLHWADHQTYLAAGQVAEGSSSAWVESGNSQGIVHKDACGSGEWGRFAQRVAVPSQMCERWKIATHAAADPAQLQVAVEGRPSTPSQHIGVHYDSSLRRKPIAIDRDLTR